MRISIRFSDHLRATAHAVAGTRGSENVRVHLLRAAAEALEDREYRDLKTLELCEAVGISRSTFYLHYSSKDELLRDMAEGLAEFELTLMPSLADRPTAWEGVLRMTEWRIKFLLANLYLIEACASLSDSSHEVNKAWYAGAEARKNRAIAELRRYPEFADIDQSYFSAALDVVSRGINGLTYSLAGRNSGWSTETKRMSTDDLPGYYALFLYRCLLGGDPAATETGARAAIERARAGS